CIWVLLTNPCPTTVTLPAASLVFPAGGFETVLYPQNTGTITLVAQADANRGLPRYVNGVPTLNIAAGQPVALRIGQDSNWYAISGSGAATAIDVRTFGAGSGVADSSVGINAAITYASSLANNAIPSQPGATVVIPDMIGYTIANPIVWKPGVSVNAGQAKLTA